VIVPDEVNPLRGYERIRAGFRRAREGDSQPQRGCVGKPKVATRRLPWVVVRKTPNRKVVAAAPLRASHAPLATTPLAEIFREEFIRRPAVIEVVPALSASTET